MAPWIASIAGHAMVVIAALVIAAPGSDSTPREFVTIDLFAPALASGAESEEAATADAPGPPAEAQTEASPQPAQDDAAGLSLAALLDAPELGETMGDRRAPAEGEAAPVDAGALESTLALEAVAAEGAALAGMGASEARRIVYVLDASGSMVTTWPDAALAVEQSIRGLHPTQRFAVIVHPQGSGAGWPAGASFAAPRIPPTASKPTLLDATPGNIERALAWLRSRAPSGRSMSQAALAFAASLEPDAIFLISSGDWDAAGQERAEPVDVVDELRRALGKTPPTIKVIAVEREDATGALEAIARAFGGEEGYRLLTAAELARRAGRSDADEPASAPDGPR